MAEPSSPTVWRRWLALELRRLRHESGLDQKEAGKRCGWSGARLSYIEAAKQSARVDDLDKLLPLYNVPEDERAQYYEAAELSRRRGWWERYEREMSSYMSLFLGLEQGASSVRTYEPAVVPGLLQTPEYAEAMLRRDISRRPDREIRQLVDLRMRRQQVMTREEKPQLKYSAVLDEAVLWHLPEAGALAMAAQLEHIARVSELPNVTVRVIPFKRGAQTYSQTNFVIFEIAPHLDPVVVYIELRDRALYLEESEDTRGFDIAFQHLVESAHNEDDSRAMMRAIAKEHRSK